MNEPIKLLIAYDGSSCADAALADLQQAGLPDEVEAVVISVADVWLPPRLEAGEQTFPERMPVPVPKRIQAVRALAQARFLALRARRQRTAGDYGH